jgi:hypothetical protein
MKVANVKNFDPLCVFAALQVTRIYTFGFLGYRAPWVDILGLCPDVSIFFFVSGFIIFTSF